MDQQEFDRLLSSYQARERQKLDAAPEAGPELDTEALAPLAEAAASMAEQVGIQLPQQAPIPEQSVRRDDGTDVTQMPAGPEQGLGDAVGGALGFGGKREDPRAQAARITKR